MRKKAALEIYMISQEEEEISVTRMENWRMNSIEVRATAVRFVI